MKGSKMKKRHAKAAARAEKVFKEFKDFRYPISGSGGGIGARHGAQRRFAMGRDK
jgi:hypothetical protein